MSNSAFFKDIYNSWIRFLDPQDCPPSALSCSAFREVLTISSLLKRKQNLGSRVAPVSKYISIQRAPKQRHQRKKKKNKTTAYSKRGLYSLEVLTCDFKEIQPFMERIEWTCRAVITNVHEHLFN